MGDLRWKRSFIPFLGCRKIYPNPKIMNKISKIGFYYPVIRLYK